MAHREQAATYAEEILDGLSGPLTIDGHPVFVTASIGVAAGLPGDCPADELCRRADIALYQAKAEGRAGYKIFEGDRQDFTIERLELDSELRHALRNEELELHYQPEVDLRSGRISGFEVLLAGATPQRVCSCPQSSCT
jgi:predicted signal transduction protein with EAL and GGDEF domain